MEYIDPLNYFLFAIVSPLLAAFLAFTLWDYPDLMILLSLPPLFYLGTCILAAVVAHRLKFHKYRLHGGRSAWGVFWGCIFLWIVYFPLFILGWVLVAGNRAQPMPGKIKANTSIIVLAIIWNLFWLGWAMIAIPSIFPSRIRMNECAARESLRSYFDAQNRYRAKTSASANGARPSDGEYCDNFRNLFYGAEAGAMETALISKKLADAFAGPATGASILGNPAKQPSAFCGYLFLEDSYVANNQLWKEQFGMVAYPRTQGITGQHIFWIGATGKLFFHFCENKELGIRPRNNPLCMRRAACVGMNIKRRKTIGPCDAGRENDWWSGIRNEFVNGGLHAQDKLTEKSWNILRFGHL